MDDALFNFGPRPTSGTTQPTFATAEQLRQIRQALDLAGIASQKDRKTVVQSAMSREVTSLNQLHAEEVTRVIYRINDIINANNALTSDSHSAWDERDEETWIDKM